MQSNHEYGFFRALFDFKLKHFITMPVLRILNIVSVVWHILIGSIVLIGGFFGAYGSDVNKLFFIIGAPIGTILLLIISRLWIEFLANLYRIGDNTQLMVENLPSK
jgi:uncharacterized membrane protein YdbT with pleckstrin-like domain